MSAAKAKANQMKWKNDWTARATRTE